MDVEHMFEFLQATLALEVYDTLNVYAQNWPSVFIQRSNNRISQLTGVVNQIILQTLKSGNCDLTTAHFCLTREIQGIYDERDTHKHCALVFYRLQNLAAFLEIPHIAVTLT
ncbi:hypothetical protein [Nitrosospira multiformis]|uniref:hypothetical protein n=1 Tax=Nitrosospira multiformis TaxID=1231 RepID=UPI002158CED9|nr:hypothetical protein [Nitrosospira multiformis]